MRLVPVIVFISALTAVAADTPTAEEKAAIEGVAKLGGKGSLDPRLPESARVAVKFEMPSDNVLAGLKKFPQVGAVDVADASRCTAKGYSPLTELPNLRKLVLEKAEITPAAATAIGQCKELRHLGLVSGGLTDAHLASMKKLTLLEYLTISGNPRITDKGMLTVKEFDRLQILYLGNTSITDKGLAELKLLDGLRTLSVVGTKVTSEAAEKFADEMPNLRSVRR